MAKDEEKIKIKDTKITNLILPKFDESIMKNQFYSCPSFKFI